MSSSVELEELTALQIGEAVNNRELKPAEVVEYFIRRINERNASINAFVYLKEEEALQQAAVLEDKIKKGRYCGPFAGVPFALKDFLPSKKGWTHSHGGVRSLIREDPYSSVFCTTMETLGGIAIGKTNSPAFGFRGLCDNKLYGPTRNPFNLKYNSGGSSGGSAAAVAAGLVPIAEGGDAGGSIRIPAAWCSCYGFKASVGTIPSVCRPDAWAATHPFCVNGGITRSVDDSAVLLQYMQRYDPRDPFSYPLSKDVPLYLTTPVSQLRGIKIAFTADFGIFAVDPEVATIVYKAAKSLEELGATVDLVSFNFKHTADELADIWCRSICIDTAIELELYKKEGLDLVKDHRDELPDEFIYWNDIAAKSDVLDYYDINLARTDILDAQQDVFDRYDIIISPTTACLPVRNSSDGNTLGPETINGTPVERLIGFSETFLFNFTGNPAASIPAGMSSNGLPIGMQVVGKRFRDVDVIRVSRAFEKLCPWKNCYKNIVW